MLHITILGQCSLSIPPENIRKQRVFLMFSGSIEIGLWPNGFTVKTKKAKTKMKQQQQQQQQITTTTKRSIFPLKDKNQ